MRGFEAEVEALVVRDRDEQQGLIERHFTQRNDLKREAQQSGLSAHFEISMHPDPRQKLVLPPDDLPFSKAQLSRNPALILVYISKKKAQFSRVDILRELGKRIDDPFAL